VVVQHRRVCRKMVDLKVVVRVVVVVLLVRTGRCLPVKVVRKDRRQLECRHLFVI